MLRRRYEPFLMLRFSFFAACFLGAGGFYRAANYMSDIHEMVINNVGEMVSWETVRLQDDKVVLCGLLPVQPIYDIVYLCWSGAALEPDGVGFTLCGSVGGLLAGNAQACARVETKGAIGLERLFLVKCHIVLRAEAPESLALLD